MLTLTKILVDDEKRDEGSSASAAAAGETWQDVLHSFISNSSF